MAYRDWEDSEGYEETLIDLLTTRLIGITYEEAAPASMIGASNHFEVAIATVVTLFVLESGAALSTVVGVLIEVPTMLLLVTFCLKTKHWFPSMLQKS
jgi:ACR3 family arsenite transporter